MRLKWFLMLAAMAVPASAQDEAQQQYELDLMTLLKASDKRGQQFREDVAKDYPTTSTGDMVGVILLDKARKINGKILTWVRSYPIGGEDGYKMLAFHIDCNKWRFATATLVYYDNDGNIYEQYSREDYELKFEQIFPDSIGETTAEAVCRA